MMIAQWILGPTIFELPLGSFEASEVEGLCQEVLAWVC